MAEISASDWQEIIDTLIAEAGGQGEESMRRVAETIINRAAVRGLSLGDVVRQPHQYTGYSAPGPAAVEAQQSQQMREVARRAWDRALQPGDPTGGADHYFNPSIVDPGWQRSMRHMGDYGGHAYYASRPIPPNDLANAVATMLDVAPQTRDVAMPRPRPTSPTDQANRLFAGTAANAGAGRRPALNDSLGDFIARQNQQQLLIRPNQIDRSVTAARAGQDPLLARVLGGYVQPKASPTMTTAQVRADNGQTGPNRISRSTQQSIADLFGMNGDPGTPARGQTVGTVRTAPPQRMSIAEARADNGQNRSASNSGIGKPPAIRTVQSVSVPPAAARPTPAPKPTPAQQRADNGQTRPAAARPAAQPKPAPAPKMTSAQQRADNGQTRPSQSRMSDLGGPISFSQIADLFAPVPQAAGSVNNRKDQSRLTDTSVIGRADNKVLELHGLAPPKVVQTAAAAVPLPKPQPQVAPKPQAPFAPKPVAPKPVVAPALAFAPRPVAAAPALRAITSNFGDIVRSSPPPSVTGTSTGRSYQVGSRYSMGGDMYVANANGSFTNQRTGRTTAGSSGVRTAADDFGSNRRESGGAPSSLVG